MGKFKILSLDGGGIRGSFSAACLARLEKELGKPIYKYFDLIAGTSTGGIIAIALALGISAQEIEDFYKEYGEVIFSRRYPLSISWYYKPLLWILKKHYPALNSLDFDWFRQTKYDSEPLREALENVFENKILKDANRRLVIPSVNLTTGQTKVFKTPHQPYFIEDLNYRAVDVVLATTAAPTYFPHTVIKEGSAYVDGGLWANNPSMIAHTEATKIAELHNEKEIQPKFSAKDIHLLSIGTGIPNYSLEPPETRAGLGWWIQRLFDVSSISQSQGVNFQCSYVLGKRYQRINFYLTDEWKLDAVEKIPNLINIGHEKAIEKF